MRLSRLLGKRGVQLRHDTAGRLQTLFCSIGLRLDKTPRSPWNFGHSPFSTSQTVLLTTKERRSRRSLAWKRTGACPVTADSSMVPNPVLAVVFPLDILYAEVHSSVKVLGRRHHRRDAVLNRPACPVHPRLQFACCFACGKSGDVWCSFAHLKHIRTASDSSMCVATDMTPWSVPRNFLPLTEIQNTLEETAK